MMILKRHAYSKEIFFTIGVTFVAKRPNLIREKCTSGESLRFLKRIRNGVYKATFIEIVRNKS